MLVVAKCLMFSVLFQGKKYRAYSQDSMAEAYRLWKAGTSVYKAAKLTGVPKQTLRDRTCGKIAPSISSSGPSAIFTKSEDESLTKHIISVAMSGYGYTRFDLRCIATDLAVYLNKRASSENVLSEHWLYGFLSRNPTLKVTQPKPLAMARANNATKEKIAAYFQELKKILVKYNLMDKPHRIFNIDETNLSPEHKPPSVIGPRGAPPPAITSPRSSTTTLISCCSATGQVLPPFMRQKSNA